MAAPLVKMELMARMLKGFSVLFLAKSFVLLWVQMDNLELILQYAEEARQPTLVALEVDSHQLRGL